MFKKSRKKIVAAIMSVLVLLWVGTLGIIYVSSYYETSKQNRAMLEELSAFYQLEQTLDGFLPGKPRPNLQNPKYSDLPEFKLSTFYSVAISYTGKILAIHNQENEVYTDKELEALALELWQENRTAGIKENLVYQLTDKGGYVLIAFMDNTIIHENMMTFFRYTLIFGFLAIIVLFFLACYLAKKIMEPIEESYQKQKQFISDAGHELKTPIAVISANAELLERAFGENQWLANIQYENERMGMLVGQLLQLARTENVAPQMEEIDLSRLVNGEALPFESVAFEKGMLLEAAIETDLHLLGNSGQLKQLISILLDNAIRHGAEGGTVQLILRREHGAARLSVINKGKEIPLEQRALLFERFYRMDTARNGEEKHYGLGLAIAKAIVTAHQGEIKIECYDGLVEFQVTIPLEQKNRK